MTRLLHVVAWSLALVATPAMMIVGYSSSARMAAVQFRITDVWEDYSVGLLTSALLLLGLFLWTSDARERLALGLLWAIHTGVALGAMLPYEAYYGLDANNYYLTGLALGPSLDALAFGQGTTNVAAICGLLSKFTTSYAAMKLVFGYVGLLSVFIFYRAIRLALGQRQVAVLYVLGLFPSILFWSSILGKDPVVLLGIAVYALGAVHFFAGNAARGLALLVAGTLIAIFMRIWLGPILFASFLGAVVLTGRLGLGAKIAIMLACVPLFLVSLNMAADSFRIETTDDLVTRTDDISKSWERGGSAQSMVAIGSLSDMLAFLPLGVFTALFRPLPGEILNPFGMVAGLQNAVVLLLLARGLLMSGWRWVKEPLLCWVVLTLLFWSCVYGFVSYQNLGTAFRFQVQVEPFLVALILVLNFWRLLLPRAEARGQVGEAEQQQQILRLTAENRIE